MIQAYGYNAPMKDLIEQLKRRKVIRSIIAYIIVAWLVIQIAETTFEPMGMPEFATKLVIILAALGLPVVTVMSWVFDIGAGKTDSAPAETGDATTQIELSVAVLPFADLSPDRDNEYFADGLAEELLNVLAQMGGLRVASRTSCFALKGSSLDVREVADRLKVSHVIEGSVRKSGDMLRITGQLIEAAGDAHLWSGTFDRELNDIFAIQDEIAREISNALHLKLTPRTPGDGNTDDVRAYDSFLRGRSYYYSFGLRNTERAIDLYRHAVELDPGFARAWAALAMANSTMADIFSPSAEEKKEFARSALDAAARCASLSPDSAESHLASGMAQMVGGQTAAAESEFREAVRLAPHMGDAWYHYARAEFTQGRKERAAELFEKACVADPADYRSPLLLVTVYNSLGEVDKSRDAARRGVELVEKHVQSHPEDARALALSAGALFLIGQKERARTNVDRALAIDPDNESTLYNAACFYAQCGESVKALDMLERCLHSSFWIEYDSDFDPIRDHPRFKAYIESIR